MDSNLPIVSVIVACFNQGEYLEEAIKSVIHQTYKNWECIIVDDGSTDNSEQVVQQLLATNNRIQYYKIKNSGVSFVRNFGIEKCKGEYILPLDADDYIDETYIEKAIGVFVKEHVKLVYCDAELFGAKSGRFNLPDFSLEELSKMNMIFCSAVFKKVDFVAAGGYNLNMKFGWEDWDLWVAMFKNGGKVYKIPEVLFHYRIKEQSRTGKLEGIRKQKTYMQLYLNHPDFFDQYHNQPLEIFPEFVELQGIARRLGLVKGLVTLRPSTYRHFAKKLTKNSG